MSHLKFIIDSDSFEFFEEMHDEADVISYCTAYDAASIVCGVFRAIIRISYGSQFLSIKC